MTVIEKSALLRFSAAQMFALVADIEAYPQFLPWCYASKVLSEQSGIVEAELDIARAGFRKQFTTRNTNIEFSQIEMSLLNGPFDSLQGGWQFVPLREDACKITLHLDFQLPGTIAALAFGKVFNQICETMVDAFQQRAIEIYASKKHD